MKNTKQYCGQFRSVRILRGELKITSIWPKFTIHVQTLVLSVRPKCPISNFRSKNRPNWFEGFLYSWSLFLIDLESSATLRPLPAESSSWVRLRWFTIPPKYTHLPKLSAVLFCIFRFMPKDMRKGTNLMYHTVSLKKFWQLTKAVKSRGNF